MCSWTYYYVGKCRHGYASFMEEREIEKDWTANVFYKDIASNCPHCHGTDVAKWNMMEVKKYGSE